jgi:hypothetical protein
MKHTTKSTPQRNLLPILERIKQAYLLWHEYHSILSKTHRYTLGNRIDMLFIEIIEALSAAVFLKADEKLPYLRLATRKLDTAKLLLLVLWECRSLDTNKYAILSEKLDGMGKMLGGWQGQLIKTHPGKKPE